MPEHTAHPVATFLAARFPCSSVLFGKLEKLVDPDILRKIFVYLFIYLFFFFYGTNNKPWEKTNPLLQKKKSLATTDTTVTLTPTTTMEDRGMLFFLS